MCVRLCVCVALRIARCISSMHARVLTRGSRGLLRIGGRTTDPLPTHRRSPTTASATLSATMSNCAPPPARSLACALPPSLRTPSLRMLAPLVEIAHTPRTLAGPAMPCPAGGRGRACIYIHTRPGTRRGCAGRARRRPSSFWSWSTRSSRRTSPSTTRTTVVRASPRLASEPRTPASVERQA